MDNKDNGNTRNQLDQDYSDKLITLESPVRVAIEFAEQWNEPYRPYVFQAALARLTTDENSTLGPMSEASPTSGSASHTPAEGASTDSDTPLSKLAQSVDVEIDFLRRVIQIDEDGVIEILGRLEDDSDSVKEQQNKYSVVYAFVREEAFGDRSVGIEDLRALCKKHGCYDTANFTHNFRKDVRLRERKGEGRAKQYVATKKGLKEAAELIQRMADD